jgi:hypothetical protein
VKCWEIIYSALFLIKIGKVGLINFYVIKALLIISDMICSLIPFVDEIEYAMSSIFQTARLISPSLWPFKFMFFPFIIELFSNSYIL